MASNEKPKSDKLKDEALTDIETKVLRLLSVGFEKDEIADIHSLSLHEVEAHISSIFEKISASNIFQATLWALKNL